MSVDWDEPEDVGDDDKGEDAGFLGGGGVAETVEGDDDELDEHGDNLATVDDEEL